MLVRRIAKLAGDGMWHVALGLGAVALASLLSACSQHYIRGQAAVEQGTALSALQINKEDVRYQSSCVLTQKRTRGNLFFECLYVQTATHLHFLFFNAPRQEFEPVLALPISELKSISYRRTGFNSQIQIAHANQMMAFSLLANLHITEDAYKSLVAAGAPQVASESWIDMQPPQGPAITIPVYVGH